MFPNSRKSFRSENPPTHQRRKQKTPGDIAPPRRFTITCCNESLLLISVSAAARKFRNLIYARVLFDYASIMDSPRGLLCAYATEACFESHLMFWPPPPPVRTITGAAGQPTGQRWCVRCCCRWCWWWCCFGDEHKSCVGAWLISGVPSGANISLVEDMAMMVACMCVHLADWHPLPESETKGHNFVADR